MRGFWTRMLMVLLGATLPALAAAPTSAPADDKFTLALFQFDEAPGEGKAPASAAANPANLKLAPAARLEAGGKFGGALRLKARSEASQARTILDVAGLPPRGLSVDLWFKPEQPQTQYLRNFYIVSSSTCFIRWTAERKRFEAGVAANNAWLTTEPKGIFTLASPDDWHHIAASYDGTTVRLLVDGKEIAAKEGTGDVPPTPFVLGGVGWTNQEPTSDFSGWIDVMRVSSIARPDFSGALGPAAAVPTSVAPAPAAAVATGEKDRPFVLIPKTDAPPPIDGRAAGGTWEKAAWVGNPVRINESSITRALDMRVGLLWDARNLYVAFRIQQQRPPTAITTTSGDDGLERDDSAEVTLWVPGFAAAKGQPVQFKLNCEGQRDDAIHFNFGWNAKWEGKAAKSGNGWTATFKIPFENFDAAPQVNDRWGANFAAFLVGGQYQGHLWAPMFSRHHHDAPGGTLVFGPADAPTARFGELASEMASLRQAGWVSAPAAARLLLIPMDQAVQKTGTVGNVVTNFEDEDGRRAAYQTRQNVNGDFKIEVNGVRPGRYWAKTILTAGGRDIQIEMKPVTIRRSLETRVRPYPIAGKAAAVVTVYDLGKPGLAPGRVELTLTDAAGKALRTVEHRFTEKTALPAEHLFLLDNLSAGSSYTLNVKALAAGDGAAVDDSAQLTLAERPAWADTKAGSLNGEVLKPWTPVEVKGQTIGVWNRRYELGKGMLFSAISSGDKPILAGPMQIVIGGQPTAATEVKVDRSATGDQANFTSVADAAQAKVTVNGRVEFDGFAVVNLAVEPKAAVSQVAVEIPLAAELAQFLYPMPGATNRDNVGRIGAQAIGLNPVHSLWICSPTAGLWLGMESTRHWKAPAEQAAQIVRRDGQVVLCLNLHQGEVMKEKTEYQLLLQATPVRPFNPDWYTRGSRVMNGLNFGQSDESLKTAREMGAKTMILFEHWTPHENSGVSDREPEIKQLIDRCRANALDVILYFGFQVAQKDPTMVGYLEEVKGLINQPAAVFREDNTWHVSYAGPFMEYLLHHMERLKCELGMGGVYLDGTLSPEFLPSDNPAHGCGWVDAKGRRVADVPILRVREFAKRMNKLFVQEGGTVFAHLAAFPPTMGFTSSVYLGEHVGFLGTPWTLLTDRVPLEASLAMYNASNTGVPMVLCQQLMWPHLRGTHPGWYEASAAWGDLHRVGINVLIETPMAVEGIDQFRRYTKLAEFGADEATWIGYWELNGVSEAKGVQVSAWRKADGAMVVAVANLTTQPQRVTINLAADPRLIPRDGASAAGLLDGQAIRLEGQKLHVELPPAGHRLIQIR